jgi:hypothetical protein
MHVYETTSTGPGWGQGPLTPPGPPAPTFKTLQQVEPRTPISALPFTITASGSYYLTTNLVGGFSQDGVIIQSDNVTVDLNGFALLGMPSSLRGIVVSAGFSVRNVCVRNGVVRDWPGNGVDLSRAERSQVEGLRVTDNFGDALLIGPYSLIADCTISAVPGRTGIVVGAESAVRDCAVNADTGAGIHATTQCSIHHCNILTAGGDAIRAVLDNYIVDNHCRGNTTGVGIRLTSSSNRVEGNHLFQFGTGIRAEAAPNLIIRNSATSNTTNYFFTVGQAFGPTNAVSGVVTNHPWANFSF